MVVHGGYTGRYSDYGGDGGNTVVMIWFVIMVAVEIVDRAKQLVLFCEVTMIVVVDIYRVMLMEEEI